MTLDKTDQAELNMHFECIFNAMEIGIIATVCMECGLFIGLKDGEGCYGISHGFCLPCKEKALKRMP